MVRGEWILDLSRRESRQDLLMDGVWKEGRQESGVDWSRYRAKLTPTRKREAVRRAIWGDDQVGEP